MCNSSFIFSPRKRTVFVAETGPRKQLNGTVVFALGQAHGYGRPSHQPYKELKVMENACACLLSGPKSVNN
ncbi:hypothetical protein HUJ04_005470 [Dendroctonus ponderosae]|nr:hypothetical protein HUJ04_005470 [Dendroctonus ponderosae]